MPHVQTVEVFNDGATRSSFNATTAITIGGGADRVAVAYIYGLAGSIGSLIVPGAITLGGVAATGVVKNGSANSRIWSIAAYFKAPATGALTLSVNLGESFRALGAFVSEYTDIDQTTVIGATNAPDDTATENFRTLDLTTTAANSEVFAGFGTQEGLGAVPTVAGATLRISRNVNSECAGAVAGELVATASASTLTFSSSAVNRNVGISIELLAAAGGGGGTILTADNLASTSSVGSPVLSQVHALAGVGLAALSVVGAPALMQGHTLVGSSVVSASSVSAPALTQSYSLTGSGLVSASSVSTPALSQVHSLSGADLVSASYVSSPSMGGGVALTADGLVSASYVSAPAITQAHSLSGGPVTASFALSTPVLSQAHSLATAGLVSASDVGAPALTQSHALSGAGLVSGSYLSQPALTEGVPIVFTPSPERTLILGSQSRQVVTYAQSRQINAAVQRG